MGYALSIEVRISVRFSHLPTSAAHGFSRYFFKYSPIKHAMSIDEDTFGPSESQAEGGCCSLEIEEVPVGEAFADPTDGKEDGPVDDISIMYDHFLKHGLKATDDDHAQTQEILGRAPRGYESFVREVAEWVFPVTPTSFTRIPGRSLVRMTANRSTEHDPVLLFACPEWASRNARGGDPTGMPSFQYEFVSG